MGIYGGTRKKKFEHNFPLGKKLQRRSGFPSNEDGEDIATVEAKPYCDETDGKKSIHHVREESAVTEVFFFFCIIAAIS